MKEELYIINTRERIRLDLPNSSGVTLKWQFNLFGDLSKLSCSYSYTFKIPFTSNNRKAMLMAEDIRQTSSLWKKVVKAEFFVNGVCLCENANLYIQEITSTDYSCFMTWNRLDDFEKLKSSSLNINELPAIGTVLWKTGDSELAYGKPSVSISNLSNVLFPNYDAGVPYTAATPPKPVVPIMRIIQLINQRFNTNIKIGTELEKGMGVLPLQDFNNNNYYKKCVYDDYVTHGVIPLTGNGITGDDVRAFTVMGIYFTWIESFRTGSHKQFGYYYKYRAKGSDIVEFGEKEWQDYPSVTHNKLQYSFLSMGGLEYFEGNISVFPVVLSVTTLYKSFDEGEAGKAEFIVRDNKLYRRWRIECTQEAEDVYKCDKATKNTNIGFYGFGVKYESIVRGSAELHVSKQAIAAGHVKLEEYRWIYLLQAEQFDEEKGSKMEVYTEKSEDWIGLRSYKRYETANEWVYLYDFGSVYAERKLTVEANKNGGGYFFWSGIREQGEDGDGTSVENWRNPYAREYEDPEEADTFDEAMKRIDPRDLRSVEYYVYLRNINIDSITPTLEYEALPCNLDIISNLPEISCFNFMKSIFYMSGAIPSRGKGGEIKAIYYNELRDKMNAGIAVDWSDKIIGGVGEASSSIKFSNTNFGRENYLLMSGSAKENNDTESLDKYSTGVGKIVLDDNTLDGDKTLFTASFYPPFVMDAGYPLIKTGRTLKVWNGERVLNDKTNPIYGVINYRGLDSTFEDVTCLNDRPFIGGFGIDFRHFRMNTFNPFEDNPEIFEYLREVLSHYVIVKEKFSLTEFDLRDIDESCPIYLNKYNAYFAVYTIQRDKDGVSTCELIKLPYQVPTAKATPIPYGDERDIVLNTPRLVFTDAVFLWFNGSIMGGIPTVFYRRTGESEWIDKYGASGFTIGQLRQIGAIRINYGSWRSFVMSLSTKEEKEYIFKYSIVNDNYEQIVEVCRVESEIYICGTLATKCNDLNENCGIDMQKWMNRDTINITISINCFTVDNKSLHTERFMFDLIKDV